MASTDRRKYKRRIGEVRFLRRFSLISFRSRRFSRRSLPARHGHSRRRSACVQGPWRGGSLRRARSGVWPGATLWRPQPTSGDAHPAAKAARSQPWRSARRRRLFLRVSLRRGSPKRALRYGSGGGLWLPAATSPRRRRRWALRRAWRSFPCPPMAAAALDASSLWSVRCGPRPARVGARASTPSPAFPGAAPSSLQREARRPQLCDHGHGPASTSTSQRAASSPSRLAAEPAAAPRHAAPGN